jgi:hypothetical protein
MVYLWSFCLFFPGFVCCTKKNLATPASMKVVARVDSDVKVVEVGGNVDGVGSARNLRLKTFYTLTHYIHFAC